MQASKKVQDFLESEAGDMARQQLISMMNDNTYNTQATYTPSPTLYPNNQMPFVDKHLRFLSTHPKVDPTIYLGNLRLMTRIK